jgi:glycosyltransferase involved in cell wall biosynthesis
VNTLVVAPDLPWPSTTGNRIRNAAVVAGLARLGDVDLFSLVGPRSETSEDPTGTVRRLHVTPRPQPRPRRAARARWIATGRLPWSLSERDWGDARAAFAQWIQPSYDLVWLLRAAPFVGFGDLITAPLVVDLDDLEDWKIVGRHASSGPPRRRTAALVELDRRRWRTLYDRITSAADAVTLCSEIDRARLGAPNAAVVPNGYPPPVRPLGRSDVGVPPTLLLVGLFTYQPNIDAAFHFVHDILPKLHTVVPDVQVRLVGDHRGEIASLADTPGVAVTGLVPDIGTELARADAMVVPVRYGSGTRVKILEAFAHRLPVIATPAACEGLDVEAGTHLAIASTPDEFANACRGLLTDPPRRARMAVAAEDLYRRRYTTDSVAEAVAEVAGRVTAGTL